MTPKRHEPNLDLKMVRRNKILQRNNAVTNAPEG